MLAKVSFNKLGSRSSCLYSWTCLPTKTSTQFPTSSASFKAKLNKNA